MNEIKIPENKTLFLIRHCSATGQDPSAPLTEEGHRQAGELASRMAPFHIERIVSSPFLRARQSVEPLAERLKLTVEIEDRLKERVLCGEPLPDWERPLEASFADLGFCLLGGETGHAAVRRGIAVIQDALRHDAKATALVTHGNLLTLLLKQFDDRFGFEQWRLLENPDVYQIALEDGETRLRHLTFH
jgi:2,3-bisphosphoglycerate-dependent phosphoglycerate mutase